MFWPLLLVSVRTFSLVISCMLKIKERSLGGPLSLENFPHLSNFKSLLSFAEPAIHH